MDTPSEWRLRQALLSVDAYAAVLKAVDKGVHAGTSAWSDAYQDKQLHAARRVALKEFAALMGWDIDR